MAKSEIAKDKYSARGIIGASFTLAAGIAIMTGGVDLPTVGVIFGLIAMLIGFTKNAPLNILAVAGRNWSLMVVGILTLLYFLGGRYYNFHDFNFTARTFVIGFVFIPFLIWSLTGQRGEDKKLLGRALIGIYCAIGFLFVTESFDHYRIYSLASPDQTGEELERNLGRGSVILLVFLWPVIANISRLKIDIRVCIGAIIGAIILAFSFGIDLNIMMFFIAGSAFLVALKFPRTAIATTISVALIDLISAPWLYSWIANTAFKIWGDPDSMPMSYERRAQMWLFAIDRIKEKPLYGWGLDAARTFDKPLFERGFWWTQIQLHPHSAPLNIWLEGGALGIGLLSLFILLGGFVLVERFGNNPKAAAPLCASISSVIIAWAFTYGAWQQWLWVTLIVAIAYAYALGADEKKLKDDYNDGLVEI